MLMSSSVPRIFADSSEEGCREEVCPDSDDIRSGTVNNLIEGSMVVVSETSRCPTRTTETVMCEILPEQDTARDKLSLHIGAEGSV